MEVLPHTLAIDVMGSDRGPSEIILGISEALRDRDDFGVLLVGDQSVIHRELQKLHIDQDPRLEIVHASEVIGMDEKPVHSLRAKKDASVIRAIELVQEGKAGAILGCGNTGALMAGSTLKLRTMEGVERPVLVTVIPTFDRYIVMADVGANPNTTPIQMVHNAILSSDYAVRVLGIEHPRIGLLTIGTEEGKGNELTLTTHEYLKQLKGIIHYSGLIEGFQVFEGAVDIVLCDGFVGNVLLKTLESLVTQLKGYLKGELKKNPVRLLGAFLAKGAFEALKVRLNPEQYGAASLLGLRGKVLKSHGSSKHGAIRSGIRMAVALMGEGSENSSQRKILEANTRLESIKS